MHQCTVFVNQVPFKNFPSINGDATSTGRKLSRLSKIPEEEVEMVRGAGKKEENAETEKRKSLKSSAFGNSLLSDRQAASGLHALGPSKLVMKHHGKDIMRKSQRSGKNRYLFSFPGLLAPISGGKIGELKDLSTKNPILYLDFPQGQMKLFGTIVYPKNRYLTLQFSRSGKNVMCEDYFDNMIVFSDAWWIGRKDENPEEARLQFPAELNVEKLEYDFKGGAGASCDMKPVASRPITKLGEVQSPKCKLEEDSSDSKNKVFTELTPTRHSARMAGKTFKFAETSSGDDFFENGVETSEEEEKKVEAEDDLESHGCRKTNRSKRIVLDMDEADAQIDCPVPEKGKQPAKATSKDKEHPQSNKGPLVQATISTLFKKAGEKESESRKKGKMVKEKKTGTESKVQKKNVKVQLNAKRKQNKVGTDDDDIQEFTSTSQESIESSDDDWVA